MNIWLNPKPNQLKTKLQKSYPVVFRSLFIFQHKMVRYTQIFTKAFVNIPEGFVIRT
jgi:hypothetical protein